MSTKLKPVSKLSRPQTLQKFFSNPKRWVKGTYCKDDMACCLYGAIDRVVPFAKRPETRRKLIKAFRSFYTNVLKRPVNEATYNIIVFNDNVARGIKDIQWVVKKANV